MSHPLKFQTEKATEEILVALNFHVCFKVLANPIKPVLARSDDFNGIYEERAKRAFNPLAFPYILLKVQSKSKTVLKCYEMAPEANTQNQKNTKQNPRTSFPIEIQIFPKGRVLQALTNIKTS